MGELKSVDGLFEDRHFDREVIILCVRWYLRFKLSLRDLVEMMAEHAAAQSRIRPRHHAAGCSTKHQSSRNDVT